MKIIIMAISAFLCLSWAVVSFAETNLNGTYTLVRDSDNTSPKKNATVTMTLKGGAKGSVAMLAKQPGETVSDTGKYSVKGNLITMHFKEMEWEAAGKRFQFDGCTLILPFKALSGSPGPGTSTWLRLDPICAQKQNTANSSNAMKAVKNSVRYAQNEPGATPQDNTKQQKNETNAAEDASDKESCEQCKYIPCIKSFIKVREAYIQEFKKFAKEKNWGNLGKDGDDFYDLSELVTPEAKKSAAEYYDEQRADFWRAFEKRIDPQLIKDVKQYCQLDVTGGLTAMTDPLYCETNEESMKKVAKAVPCRQLYNLSQIHESYHKTRCMERLEKLKENKGPFIPKPRGEVKEEVEAYSQQIGLLKNLLDSAAKSGNQKEGCWRCGQTREVYSSKKDCNVICPKVHLGGAIMFKCFKINAPNGEHVSRINDQF